MSRLINILLSALILYNIYAFLNHGNPSLLLGYIIPMPLIGVFYGFSRKWQITVVDILIYLAFSLGSFSDASTFIYPGETGQFIQTLLALIVHLLFIIVFQKEGTHVYNLDRKNLLKLLIPAVFVFLFFGMVLLEVIPDGIYLVIVFYSVELVILIVLGYFRPVNQKSYWIGAVAVTLILLKDIFYSNYLYVIKSDVNMYIYYYIINIIAYYCIAWSISVNQNDKSTVKNYVNIVTKLVKVLKKVNLIKFSSDTILSFKLYVKASIPRIISTIQAGVNSLSRPLKRTFGAHL